MKEAREILLGGSGGQGLGLAGVILAQALSEEEGKNVVETEAYGISMRGGMSRAEVLFSSEEINEIKVTEPDVLLAMSQAIADKYASRTKKEGIIVTDTAFVSDVSQAASRVFQLPLTEEAKKLGMETAANIVALGSIIALSGIVSKESLIKVLRKKFSSKLADLNLKALEAGYEMGRKQEAPEGRHTLQEEE